MASNESTLDLEKLKKLQARTKNTSKGQPRKKIVSKASSAGTDQKVAAALKKLSVQPLSLIEEANFFKDDGHVLHFSAPKVHAAVTSNTFAIYGTAQNKELTELVPGILNQLGPESLNSLKKLAESYQSMQQGQHQANQAGEGDPDDDDVPDLVESFEVTEEAQTKESGLEEVS